jgi:hypothetical protein
VGRCGYILAMRTVELAEVVTAVELRTAVGTLESIIVGVKRAVAMFEVFLAAESWMIEQYTGNMRSNTHNEECGAG